VRKLLLCFLSVLVLLLTGCGDDAGSGDGESTEPTSITGVAVGGEFGSAPEVDIDTPVSVEETTVETLTEGDGEQITKGDTVIVNYAGLNARSGAEFDSSYVRGQPAAFVTTGVIPGLAEALEGQTVGSRVVAAVPPADGFGAEGNPDAEIEGEDTLVFVVDLISRQLPEATGAATELPETLPQLQLDDTGEPTEFVATEKTQPAPEKLVAEVVIEGDGPEIEAGQTMVAHYVGQIFPDGGVFDSSWETGQPAPFQIGAGQVIPCWDKGLVGKTVGSRVILVCPPAEGYGKQGNPQINVTGKTTLIFAIDILAAY